MSIFSRIKEEFFPPKSERELYEEQAWQNLRYSKSKEGKRQAEIDKKICEEMNKHADDINPWSYPM